MKTNKVIIDKISAANISIKEALRAIACKYPNMTRHYLKEFLDKAKDKKRFIYCDGCKHSFYERDTNYSGCKLDLEPGTCNKKEDELNEGD